MRSICVLNNFNEHNHNNEKLGLYIHVPFCLRKCLYCNFFSITNLSLINNYVDCLCAEIESRAVEGVEVDSIYFGGGTPNLLSLGQLQRILNVINSNFVISNYAEISLEFNPGLTNFAYLKGLFRLKFNRLSIGIQSADDSQLEVLGRMHKFCDARFVVTAAYKAGFKNVSADLILGIPGQTKKSLNLSLKSLLSLNLTHISAYILKIESKTPFFENKPKNLPDEDETADLYMNVVDFLKSNGFVHYEISNFALPGFECLHNLKYWTLQPYLGFGPSAHSFFEGRRFFNLPNLQIYLSRKFKSVNEPEILSKNFEWLMLRSRLEREISNFDLHAHGFYGKKFKKKLALLSKEKFVDMTPTGFKMTSKGLLLQNSVLMFLTK